MKTQKQEVPFEIRLVQSMIIGAELMMLYTLIVLIFGSDEPFEWQQTRAFGLAVLPPLVTATIHAFRVARREHTSF